MVEHIENNENQEVDPDDAQRLADRLQHLYENLGLYADGNTHADEHQPREGTFARPQTTLEGYEQDLEHLRQLERNINRMLAPIPRQVDRKEITSPQDMQEGEPTSHLDGIELPEGQLDDFVATSHAFLKDAAAAGANFKLPEVDNFGGVAPDVGLNNNSFNIS